LQAKKWFVARRRRRKKGVRGKNEEEKFASSFLPKGERGERGVE
jgi:hypothetical protein